MSDKTSNHSTHKGSTLTPTKMLVVVGLMAVAFLGAYNFALAKGQSSVAGTTSPGASSGLFAGSGAAGGGGGCCGGGGAAGGAATGGTTSGGSASGSAATGGSSAPAGGGGCCGGGGPAVEGKAKSAGGVQKIDVDTSNGSFTPNVIKVKAGEPVEINFTQSGGGCLSGAYFPDFNINQDLTSGPATVKLPALKAGTYTFYCQMQMVSATIVAE